MRFSIIAGAVIIAGAINPIEVEKNTLLICIMFLVFAAWDSFSEKKKNV